ncbi:NADH-quinone oxidoreductase subunit L [Gemmatimonas aurantiaca]|uniref:NADH-quinone oxidoreductase subunit L n=1 Tax=Gemmatimonas aurantiaca TaxID=173480 RepID=UPI00301BCE1C
MIAALLPFLILLPLLGFVVNGAVALTRASAAGDARTTARHPLVSIVGPGVIIAAFAVAMALFMRMRVGMAGPAIVTLGQWTPVGNLVVDWSFQLDQLSMVMVLVITGVGSLIHLFSIGYMQDDPGYARYFAYLNLFVAFMLVLVLGGSYPVMFVGWEGVGLASYLLIGFWFSDKANADAGKKAFVVNRVGDFGFLIAMFLIWATTQHLDFVGAHEVLGGMGGTPVVLAIALLLFVGCAGKSAQLPLYIWLPDAMAGPTPVSALIHAATMVTAGVYLVARAAPIFAGAPEASLVVTIIGALTAIFAATIALRQWDIKKVLAYSTVSQLGYMFVGVGSGAYTAGVFHLVTHAFFKALLFLGAGSVIHAMHQAYHHTHRHDDPQDLRNMGGLARFMPATAGAMTLATLAIAGVPPLAGFFSKDEILANVFARAHGSPLANASLLGIPGSTVLYIAYGLGIVTALLTAIYMTRMLLMAFYGENRTGEAEQSALHEAPLVMTGPVLVLGVLTLIGGWLNLPALLPMGPVGVLEHWLAPVTAGSAARLAGEGHLSHETEWVLVGIATGVALLGIVLALVLYRKPMADKAHTPEDTSLLARAYGVDGIVDTVIVRPVSAVADTVLARGVDRGVDRTFSLGGSLLSRTASLMGNKLQDGDVGKYAWLLAVGALALIAALTLS